MNKLKPYSFIFMDKNMPEMDGIETTRLIRQTMNNKEN
jgi:CheY-like chemotaxis protein